MTLTVVAICCVSLALVQSWRYQRLYQMSVTCSISNWTPHYAPHFKMLNVDQPVGNGFTVEAIGARRAAAERIRALDNTEFILDSFAYRCKICSALYADWLDAFECHKG